MEKVVRVSKVPETGVYYLLDTVLRKCPSYVKLVFPCRKFEQK